MVDHPSGCSLLRLQGLETFERETAGFPVDSAENSEIYSKDQHKEVVIFPKLAKRKRLCEAFS